jgi:hypothetical protein
VVEVVGESPVQRLLPSEPEPDLFILTVVSAILLVAFCGLGALIGLAWMSVEMNHLLTAGGIAVLGIIGSLISLISTVAASNPSAGSIGPFTGFYFVMALFPSLVSHGFTIYYYESNSKDYLTSKINNEDWWDEKYGPDWFLEDAIEDANYKLLIVSYSLFGVAMIIFGAIFVFAQESKLLQSLRVFVEVFALGIAILTLV